MAKPATKPLTLNPGPAVELADGVLVDAERGVAYVMAPSRGIDAVDLESNSVLWTAAQEARPLLVAGGVLLAQARTGGDGRLGIVSFDVRDGRRGDVAASLELPEGVRAPLYDEPGRTFRVRAGFVGDQLVLRWQATKVGGEEMQGYLPAPEDGAAPSEKGYERLEGAVRLDLASGAARPFEKAVAAPPALAVLPASPGKGLRGRLFTSADGRHVLASARRAEGGLWGSHRWTIHDRASGERLGTFDHFTSSAPFIVAGSRLIFVSQPYFERRGEEIVGVPRQLRAVDLESGAEQWTKDVTDPRFFGELPP